MAMQYNGLSYQLTPKQKKDLFGMYKDYLYFARGLEILLNSNTLYTFSGRFMENVGWSENSMDNRWKMDFTTANERDNYVRFTEGDMDTSKQYAYMSLYHLKKEHDAAGKKISDFPNGYEYTTMDLGLPCPIERYAITCPEGQKFKNSTIIIDGIFKLSYTGVGYDDGLMLDTLGNPKMQKEFRVMLNLMEYLDRNKYEVVRDNKTDFSNKISKVLMKIIAAEVLEELENKVLDLIGSYTNKAQEMLRCLYPKVPAKDVWKAAEKDQLILSAENMQHYLNIRHLMRHQWDSLDGTNKFALGRKNRNEQLREEYLNSYRLLFDKTLPERVKEYQKIAMQLQSFLQIFYPELLSREVGESNTKFVQRIKQWQQENPDKTALVNSNYMLRDAKHSALIKNLKKVVPTAQVLDDMSIDDFSKYEELESSYYNRASFLKVYSHLDSDVTKFCREQGVYPNAANVWQYLKQNIFTEKEYQKWFEYRQLRNKLSHNHLDEALRAELDTALDTLGDDVVKVYQKIDNFKLSHAKICAQLQDNLPVIPVDTKKDYHVHKNLPKYCPVELKYNGHEVAECKFKNGTIIDLQRQKIIFADNTRFYFDGTDFNVMRFDNNNKLFTDKSFVVTKFQERSNVRPMGRNEQTLVAPKHFVRTDGRSRLVEDIFTKDDKKTVTKFNYGKDGAVVLFADNTKVKTSDNKFAVSHNGIELTYDNRNAFMESYDEVPGLLKPPHSR